MSLQILTHNWSTPDFATAWSAATAIAGAHHVRAATGADGSAADAGWLPRAFFFPRWVSPVSLNRLIVC